MQEIIVLDLSVFQKQDIDEIEQLIVKSLNLLKEAKQKEESSIGRKEGSPIRKPSFFKPLS